MDKNQEYIIREDGLVEFKNDNLSTKRFYRQKLTARRAYEIGWHYVFNRGLRQQNGVPMYAEDYNEEIEAVREVLLQFLFGSGKSARLTTLPKPPTSYGHGLASIVKEDDKGYAVDIVDFQKWLMGDFMRNFKEFMQLKSEKEVIDKLSHKAPQDEAAYHRFKLSVNGILQWNRTNRHAQRMLEDGKANNYPHSPLKRAIAIDSVLDFPTSFEELAKFADIDKAVFDACLRCERPIGRGDLFANLSKLVVHIEDLQLIHDFAIFNVVYPNNMLNKEQLEHCNKIRKEYTICQHLPSDVTLDDLEKLKIEQYPQGENYA